LLVLALSAVLILFSGCGDDNPVRPEPEPTVWSQVLAPEYTHRAVWGVSSSHFFVASEKGSVSRFKGGEWTSWQFRYFENMRGVWGVAPDQVMAVGEGGKCYRFDGENWESIYTETSRDLYGIWGTGWDNVYAVGDVGTLIHFDGEKWTALDSGVTSLLHSVWGSGPNDIFAVGRDGTIIHFDGTIWQPMDSGTNSALDCVWGLTGNDVFAVGALGTVLHYDGQGWAAEQSGTTDRLWSVRGLPGEDPVALGARGALLIRRSGSWEYEQIAQGVDLYGLWDNGDSALLLVGYNGLVINLEPGSHPLVGRCLGSGLRPGLRRRQTRDHPAVRGVRLGRYRPEPRGYQLFGYLGGQRRRFLRDGQQRNHRTFSGRHLDHLAAQQPIEPGRYLGHGRR
jgi:hypothetical protein